MSRVVGIDPGTLSFDLCGLDNGHLFLDTTIATTDVSSQPQILIDALNEVRPLDLVIAPSGYGLPWVTPNDFGEKEYFLLALADEREQHRSSSGIGGLRALVTALQATGLPLMFMPGVIHLATVPAFRKANKIDMGTADKLCCAVLGVFDQARHFGLAYDETSFIYVELGGAFTAVLAVERGQVVDGLGGSSGAPGYSALGAMDGELAYLLGEFHKSELFSGGVSSMTGRPRLPLAEAVAGWEQDPALGRAWEAFFEGVTKVVAAEMTVVPEPREILLSGRLARLPAIRQKVAERLSRLAPVRQIASLAQTAKEAAQGAALIADGLTGGQFEPLIKTMRLREAGGTVLDHLYVASGETLKQKYLSY
ncbi:MAG TPA: DUF1464 family protein [Anaerolineae bacterium]|nr:DUF1464 family protein [Anaerolineae bacterium]HMR64467.1 DUF1464 family protein [Anaerolineae bacterium]